MKRKFFLQHLLTAALLFTYFISTCTPADEPIRYGRDECAFCKMTIMDEHFGAEIVTTKGKVFKFDDLVCMIRFIDKAVIPGKSISKKLVINYKEKNQFLDAESIFYYVSEDLHSPMNGNAAAFPSGEAAERFQNGKAGTVMTWSDVYQKLK